MPKTTNITSAQAGILIRMTGGTRVAFDGGTRIELRHTTLSSYGRDHATLRWIGNDGETRTEDVHYMAFNRLIDKEWITPRDPISTYTLWDITSEGRRAMLAWLNS